MTTRITRHVTLTALAAALLALAGCGGSSPTAVNTAVATQADADDVAMQAAIAFANVSVEADAGLSGARTAPLAAAFRGPNAPTSQGGGFVAQSADTTFQRGDVTFEIHRAFFDLTHAPQAAPDASTDSVVVTTRAFGTDSTSSAQYRVTVGHAGEMGVGGVNPVHSVLNFDGAWADTLASHFTSLSGLTTVDCYARTHGVGAGIHAAKTSPYPDSGTITWSVYAQRLRNGERGSVEKTLQATVVVTFNGTRYPTVTVNGTWSYTYDMDGHVLARAGGA